MSDQMTRGRWKDAVRQLMLARGHYLDRATELVGLIGNPEVKVYQPDDPDELRPGYMVLDYGTRTEAHILGTTKPIMQGVHHLRGSIGRQYWAGLVHQKWYDAALEVHALIQPYLPLRHQGGIQMWYYGHSLGGAIAEILAWEDYMGGRPASVLRSSSIAGPMPFTHLIPTRKHQAELLAYRGDPVPHYPGPNWLALAVDPLTNVLIHPFHAGRWQHSNDAVWMGDEGEERLPPYGADDSLWSRPQIDFTYHDLGWYMHLLELMRERREWEHDDDTAAWVQAFNDLGDGGEIKAKPERLAWHPGYPYHPAITYPGTAVFASKGSFVANKAIKCQAIMRVGQYGHSEVHYFIKAGDYTPTLDEAEAKFKQYLGKRFGVLHPHVKLGTHVVVDAIRLTREGANRDGVVRLNPKIELDTTNNEASKDELVGADFPAVAALIQMQAGPATVRQLYLRPIYDAAYLAPAGTIAENSTLVKALGRLALSYQEMACWAIKGIDRGQPEWNVQGASPAQSPLTGTVLRIQGHNLAIGDKVRVYGPGKEFKPIRGTWRVWGLIPESDDVLIREQLTAAPIPAGAKAMKVVYHYPSVTKFEFQRLTSHDVGRPMSLRHGRRRKRMV